jgi:hypothetical protein
MKQSIKRILLLGTTLGAGVLAGCTEGGDSPLAPRLDGLVASDHRGGAGPLDPAGQSAAVSQPAPTDGQPTGATAGGTLPRFSGYLLASN